MKVILLQEVKGQGVEGDVIDVADGFANNYLLPQKIAVKATKGNLKQLDQRRHNIAKREAGRISTAEDMKAKIDNAFLRIEARVGDEGQLFGSVTTQMIADALADQYGIEIDRKSIDLKDAIKTEGEHEAVVSLHRDVKATIKMLVGSAEDLAAAEQAEEEIEKAAEAVEAAAEEVEEVAEAIEEAASQEAGE